MANMIPISTVTVGSGGVSAIEFTNIPQIYTDLIVKFSLRGSVASGTIYIEFNGSSSNLSSRQIIGSGSVAASNNFSDIRTWGGQAQSAYTASTFSNAEMYIPNYSSSNNKSVSIDGVNENNATEAYSSLMAGLWSSTAPITSIKLFQSGNTLQQYSSATLYGIRKY
jgi:hypothetical protein